MARRAVDARRIEPLTARARRTRLAAIGALLLGGAIALAAAGPIRQDPGYHAFADARPLLGVANFADVASNAAFAIAGLAGLAVLARRRGDARREGALWAVVFAGLLATGAGSGWYHLAPDDARLFWDRLPMAVVFAALLAVTISERVGPRAGRALAIPLIAACAGSVLWWRLGGAEGDFRPYAFAQYGGALAIVALLALLPGPYDRGRDLAVAIACYAAAKVAEALDGPILEASGLVSGHTLKHLLAGAGSLALVVHVARRVPRFR